MQSYKTQRKRKQAGIVKESQTQQNNVQINFTIHRPTNQLGVQLTLSEKEKKFFHAFLRDSYHDSQVRVHEKQTQIFTDLPTPDLCLSHCAKGRFR